jgi:hypothetical protein
MTTNEDLVGKFIKQAKSEAKYTPPVVSRRERVSAGMLLSIIIALIYSTIAEMINILPNLELPLYFHPFGAVGNILYTMLIAGISGLISAWNEKATTSTITGGVALYAGLGLSQLLSSDLLFADFIPTAFGLLALLFMAFTCILLALFIGLVRLTVDLQLEKPQFSWWQWQKTWPILILLAMAITTGYLHKLPIGWIYSLRTVDRLIQNGLTARTAIDLPEQFREEQMGNFLEYASNEYKLEVNNSLQALFYQADPYLSISFRENIVVVYFKSGQDVACLANGGVVLKCLPIIRKIKLPPLIL